MLNSQTQKTLYGLMDMIYPVGSYYITESSDLNTAAKMGTKFGGTWVKISNKFLYGTSADSGAGTEGGSNDAKVISHNHTFTGDMITGHTGVEVDTGSPSGAFSTGSGTLYRRTCNGTSGTRKDGYNCYFEARPTGTISTVGDSGTNANMPAYRTVYIYRRTALAMGG